MPVEAVSVSANTQTRACVSSRCSTGSVWLGSEGCHVMSCWKWGGFFRRLPEHEPTLQYEYAVAHVKNGSHPHQHVLRQVVNPNLQLLVPEPVPSEAMHNSWT